MTRQKNKNGALNSARRFASLSDPVHWFGSSSIPMQNRWLQHQQPEEPVGAGQVQADRLQQMRGDSHVGHAPLNYFAGALF